MTGDDKWHRNRKADKHERNFCENPFSAKNPQNCRHRSCRITLAKFRWLVYVVPLISAKFCSFGSFRSFFAHFLAKFFSFCRNYFTKVFAKICFAKPKTTFRSCLKAENLNTGLQLHLLKEVTSFLRLPQPWRIFFHWTQVTSLACKADVQPTNASLTWIEIS